MSLFKNNYVKKLSEDFNIQFRAELFNVLNHTNFTPPNNNNQQLYNGSLAKLSTAGLLTTEAGGTDTFTVVLNSQPTRSSPLNETV